MESSADWSSPESSHLLNQLRSVRNRGPQSPSLSVELQLKVAVVDPSAIWTTVMMQKCTVQPAELMTEANRCQRLVRMRLT